MREPPQCNLLCGLHDGILRTVNLPLSGKHYAAFNQLPKLGATIRLAESFQYPEGSGKPVKIFVRIVQYMAASEMAAIIRENKTNQKFGLGKHFWCEVELD